MSTRIKFANDDSGGGLSVAGSLVLHVAFAGCIVAFAYFHHLLDNKWGDDHAAVGAIQASMVSAIPLPTKAPPSENVLATENPSENPLPPQKTEAKPVPVPDAIPIPEKVKPQPKKLADKIVPPSPKIKQTVPPKLDRIPQGEAPPSTRVAMSTMPLRNGTLSISIPSGDFGNRYAYYREQITRAVANNWWTQEADPRASTGKSVTMLFDILRDGTPTNARIKTRSGSQSLDVSAQHALQRIDTFGPLPDTYRGDRVTVEYTFEYQAH